MVGGGFSAVCFLRNLLKRRVTGAKQLSATAFMKSGLFAFCLVVWFLLWLGINVLLLKRYIGFEWETTCQHNQRWHVQIRQTRRLTWQGKFSVKPHMKRLAAVPN